VEIFMARGRTGEAEALIRAALATYERLGARSGIAWCHYYLGWAAVRRDQLAHARAWFERALELARDPGSEWLLPHVLAAVAPLAALLGDRASALEHASAAVTAARPFSMRAVLAMTLARAAEAAVLAGDAQAAEADLVELLRLLDDLGTRRWGADALELAAVVLDQRGAREEALGALQAAAQLREASGEPCGGVRAASAEVRRVAARLQRIRAFPAEDERLGMMTPPEVTMRRVRTWLQGSTDAEEEGAVSTT
jgi:tetratricopeptide (TPR) repeat protein